MARTGRPSTYTAELAAYICEEIANGKSLPAVCRASGMPKCATVFQWLRLHSEFADLYARAREAQADLYVAQIADLADRARPGKKTKATTCGECGGFGRRDTCETCGGTGRHPERPETWRCGKCRCKRCGGAGVINETTTGDMVERSKLQVDARKWLAARLAPRKYGERLELAGDKDAPLTITVRRLDRAQS